MNAPRYLGQTVDVKAAHIFDIARLEAFLADRLRGFTGPLAVRQFEGGQSSPTYLLATAERKYVLRRKPPGVLLASAHAVDREFRVMTALFERGFPVPQPLVYDDDPEIVGSPFYVMEYVEGRIFYDCRMPDLEPAARAAVFDAVNATLAHLHSFDPAEIGLADYGRPGNYFARQVSRWIKQYEASATQAIPAMDRLMQWLPAAIPEDEESRIVHGDYSFHNLMIHPTEARVVGVMDWELSTVGHPLGDLMYNLMDWYRPEGVDERGSLSGADLKAMGVPSQEDYIARYFERRGKPVPDNLGFYRAYNLFRVAAIVQGIAGRFRDGTATSGNAGEQEARVPLLAEAAWREAQKIGAG